MHGTNFLVPKLCLGTHVGKLCSRQSRLESAGRREAELRELRAQAELGHERQFTLRRKGL